jgi:hypothetical protein
MLFQRADSIAERRQFLLHPRFKMREPAHQLGFEHKLQVVAKLADPSLHAPRIFDVVETERPNVIHLAAQFRLFLANEPKLFENQIFHIGHGDVLSVFAEPDERFIIAINRDRVKPAKTAG